MKLSVIIPAHNEEGSLRETITSIHQKLLSENIVHEIIVINDNSKDRTEHTLKELSDEINSVTFYNNELPQGFGYAVRFGLDRFTGDCVALMMADLSDSPDDLVKFYLKLQEGYDCVFGDRFSKGGTIHDYPLIKRMINRLANLIVSISVGMTYNDTTNAFKLYRRKTIEGLKPFLSPHFNLTLELPLKAIIRGYTYAVVPNSWTNRKLGESKLRIREMGSRYFFILLYCLIEKFFSRGDFNKKKHSTLDKK